MPADCSMGGSLSRAGAMLRSLLLFFLSLPAWGAGVPGGVTLVYWSAADCRWCSYWEQSEIGEPELRAMPEFRRLQYVRVKAPRLADEYRQEDFPRGAEWLWERYRQGETGRPLRPSWQFWIDGRLLESYYGVKKWEEEAVYRVREVVERYAGKAPPLR